MTYPVVNLKEVFLEKYTHTEHPEWQFQRGCGVISLINKHLLVVAHQKLGKIGLPGGRVEETETDKDAAKRELFEETGIVSEVRHIFTTHYEMPERDQFGTLAIFKVDIPSPIVINREPDQHMFCGYVHVDYLANSNFKFAVSLEAAIDWLQRNDTWTSRLELPSVWEKIKY